MATAAGPSPHPRTWRLAVLATVFGLAALGLVGRLAWIQVVHHERYAQQAVGEHDTTVPVAAHRGAILDRSGYPLAVSVDAFDVYVDRAQWKNQAVALRAADQLAGYVQLTPSEIFAAVGEGDTGEALVAKRVDYESGSKIANVGIPGVYVQPTSYRLHPEGDLASGILGFLGRDLTGLAGVERDYNQVLAGEPSYYRYERDTQGRPIPVAHEQVRPGTPGANVELTIDRVLQNEAEQLLDEAIKANHATGGDAVIMDPHTGAILALVSRPQFKLSQLDLNDPKQMPLYRLRAITDTYEPGSSFKIVTMAAGLDTGTVTPNTTYNDTGTAMVGGYAIHNWDYSAHGITTMTQVLVQSLNTGTVWVAGKLGPQRFYQYVRAFGFGAPTGAGLSGEAPGYFRQPGDPGWSIDDLATNSFGQGISVTFLQMADAFATIANGGVRVQPHIVRAIVRDGQVQPEPAVTLGRAVKPETATQLTGMMEQEVQHLYYPIVPGYTAAGKSSTANVADATGYSNLRILAYGGFAPARDPRVVVMVKIDNVDNSQAWGGVIAASVWSHLMSYTLHYLGVPEDRP